MPRLIDYVGRFEFLRQAAFAVVRDEGVDALSRRRVAAELGTSVNTLRRSVAGWADLTRLAADQVLSRRRVGRLRGYANEPASVATHLVRSLMPEDLTHLDEELVWLKLVTACALQPSGLEPPGQVRREFQVSSRGGDDSVSVEAHSRQEGPAAREDRRSALQPYLDDRNRELSTSIGLILDALEVPEPRKDVAAALVALVEGLTLSACLGRLTPEQATELAVAHVLGLAPDPGEGLVRVGE